MAELVGAFGVPHMPTTPLTVRQAPHGELAQLFGAVRAHVDAVNPDVLVVFDTDHFATWSYHKLPVFALERFWTAPAHVVHAGAPDHPHGPDCGCRSIKHAGQHVDYLLNGHAHHAHEGHWDECDPALFGPDPQR